MVSNELTIRLVERCYAQDEMDHRYRTIHETILKRSKFITQPNFETISIDDLTLAFHLYDEQFYQGDLTRLMAEAGVPLKFSLSSRLTRSAGVTKRYGMRHRRGRRLTSTTHYEIALSTTLLFQTFSDVERTIYVNGLVCRDRLEAALRIFEHELTHFVEMVVWGVSNCDQQRFKTLVKNYFGHLQTRHQLVTQQERARARFDVSVGDRVRFECDGELFEGIVNRITQRATILVESTLGETYSDGKRYRKFYVPLTHVRKAR